MNQRHEQLKVYRTFLDVQNAERDRLHKLEISLIAAHDECKDRQRVLDESISMVNAVMLATVAEIKQFIEESVSLCLQVVYGSEYRFVLDYDINRGRTEAKALVQRDELLLDPKAEMGGGVVDVASIGARLVLWMLSTPRTSPVFVFDEPFRFVSRDRTQNLVSLLREISKTFASQVIMVSHNDQLIDGAHRVVQVIRTKTGSVVE